jgi:hypothetical protein
MERRASSPATKGNAQRQTSARLRSATRLCRFTTKPPGRTALHFHIARHRSLPTRASPRHSPKVQSFRKELAFELPASVRSRQRNEAGQSSPTLQRGVTRGCSLWANPASACTIRVGRLCRLKPGTTFLPGAPHQATAEYSPAAHFFLRVSASLRFTAPQSQ